MLNNAWPSMIWHLYDWYLRPGGSYFGVKIACEPVHVQYSYDDRSIVVVNSYYKRFAGLKVTAKVYNLDMTEKFSREATLDVGPDSSTRVFILPELDGLSSTYFVNLRLESSGSLLSRNFYWLSTRPETLDWERSRDEPDDPHHSTWTPTKTFADYTALNTLPQVELDVSASSQRGESESSTTVTLRNPSRTLAFAIRLKIARARTGCCVSREGPTDESVLPVLWQDNYFALLPGESRQVTATYRTKDLSHSAPVVEVGGWNVKLAQVPAERSESKKQTGE
jgi:exo-1,4-beta-D-glucosaminidase